MAGYYHYTDSGLDYVFLKNGFVTEQTNYGEAVAIHDIEGLHKAIAKDIINHRVKLSGQEFRFLRRELELSQKALGDIFGVSDQTVALWEKGKSQIQKTADMLLREMYMDKVIGQTGIYDIIERINEHERKIAELQIEIDQLNEQTQAMNMEESNGGWQKAA